MKTNINNAIDKKQSALKPHYKLIDMIDEGIMFNILWKKREMDIKNC